MASELDQQENKLSDARERALAETVRQACIQTALDAYEEGGLAGLCAEGRWDMAIDALRTIRLDELLHMNKPEGS